VEFQRKLVPFIHRGMNWNAPLEKIPEGQLPWAKNVRVLAQGTITSAHGYTVARGIDGASFTPLGGTAPGPYLHSFSRLNISNLGFDVNLSPMYVMGADTELYAFNKDNTLHSSLNPLHTPQGNPAVGGNQFTVFSGNPLSIVDVQPAGANVSWKYIGDSQQMVTVGYYPADSYLNMARCLTVGLRPPVHSHQVTVNAGGNLLGGYAWMFAYRRVPTGARSNPSAAARDPSSPTAPFFTYQVSGASAAFSAAITLPSAPPDPQTGSPDSNVVVDIYRFGGVIFRWALVGTSQAGGGGTFTDNTPDSVLLAAPSPPQTIDPTTGQSRFNLFQPFVTPDIAHSATVATVTNDAKNRWFLNAATGTTPFILNWLAGSTIYVNNAAFSIYQVLSTSQIELAQDANKLLGVSSGAGVFWSIPAGTLMAGQPMAHLWGSYGLGQSASYLFACGDPNAPGTLYWTNGNDPDSTDVVNNIVVTAPGEKLQTGCIYDGQPYVWTTERQFQIFPSLTVFGQFTVQEVAGAKGVWLEWSLSVQSNGITDQSVTWRGKDGIYDWSTAGGLRRLTDDLYAFFPHDNSPGLAPETIMPFLKFPASTRPNDPGYLPESVGNLDDSQPRFHRTCWFQGMLFYDFVAQPLGIPTALSATLAAGGSLAVATTYYVVTALSAAGQETTRSVQVTIAPTSGNQTVSLTWTAVAGAASYKVYRSTVSGTYGMTSLAGNPTGTSFTDNGAALTSGTPPAISGAFSCLVWDDVQVKGWVSLDQPFGSPASPDVSHPVARGIEIGVNNLKVTQGGTIYDYFGFTRGFRSRVITRAEDFGDPRANKLFGDYWLDLTPLANDVTVTPLRDFSVNPTLALAAVTPPTLPTSGPIALTPNFIKINTSGPTPRTNYALDFSDYIAPGFKGLVAWNLALDIRWTDPAGQFGSVLNQWQPAFVPKPESIAFRISDRDDAGVAGAKYLMGMNLEANTNLDGTAHAFPLQVIIDGQLVTTLTITHDGQTIFPYAWNPVAGYEFQVELRFGSYTPQWQLFKIAWIFEPWPDAVARTFPFQDLGSVQVKYIRQITLPIETNGNAGTIGLIGDGNNPQRLFSVLTPVLIKSATELVLNPPMIAHEIQLSTQSIMRMWPNELKADFEPWPEFSSVRSAFTNLGYEGSKFIQGAVIPLDTGGSPLSLQINYDTGGPVTLGPVTTPAGVKTPIAFSFGPCNPTPSDPFIATEVQVLPQSNARVWFDEIKWVWEPEPELVYTWDTQPTDHDLPGFHSQRDCFIAYMGGSGAPVLTITTEYGSVKYTLDPVVPGKYVRSYRVLAPQKAKWRSYRVESCGGLRLFMKDCEVRVKAWGDTGPYKSFQPFGDLSRANGGARI